MDTTRQFSTGHADFIQDVQYDFYGERIATCSSDRTIKIFEHDVQGQWAISGNIVGHSGTFSRVEWAHPEFGNVIAAICSNHNVIIYEETESAQTEKRIWTEKTRLVDSAGEVTDIKFAPHQHGLLLATASVDGTVRIYEAIDLMELSVWPLKDEFVASPNSVHCLSWNKSAFDPPQLVVGTNTGLNVWEYFDQQRHWSSVLDMDKIDGPVYSVDWAPSMGRSFHLIASGSKDRCVRIYKLSLQDETSKKIKCSRIAMLHEQNAEIWRVAWNTTGTVLATTGDDGSVYLWKSDLEGKWQGNVELRGTQHDKGELSV